VKLSDDIELMMNDDIVARKSQVDKHKQFLQGNALQIASMDKLFTDLTTQLHAEKSRQRI
jgi:alanine-alpha-ketoisovalerate/valine-pyruvate aminotransferase